MAQIVHFFGMCSSLVLKADSALSYRTTAKIAKSANIFSDSIGSYENAVSGCFHAGGRRPFLHGRFQIPPDLVVKT